MSSSSLQLQAKFEFKAQNVEELSLAKGERVRGRPPAANGWLLCESPISGKKGYVPESYLEPFTTPAPTRAAPRLNSSGGGASFRAGVDTASIPFHQTLGGWKERERRFLQGEAELLPVVRKREYYYWDDQTGARVGPVTEQEMRLRQQHKQITNSTLIAPITTAQATEALPKMPVSAYFPDAAQAFSTAPIPSSTTSELLWLYLDDQGEVQGPFAGSQMRDWFLDSYFNAQSRVRLASAQTSPRFVPLGQLFPGDGADSFLSAGKSSSSSALYDDPFAAAVAPPPPPAIGSGVPPPPPPPPPSSSSASSRGRSLLNLAMSNNPFETSTSALPPPAIRGGESDDWNIVWNDEPVPTAAVPTATTTQDASPSRDTRKLAPYAYIMRTHLMDHDATYRFLTRALDRGLGTVRCKIKRSVEGLLHVNYNRYDLYLEKDDGQLGPVIMTAIKHKRMLGADSYYEMQVGSVSATHQGTVIGETMLTSLGSQFLLHNNVKMHSGVAKDLACVHYLSTGEEGGPRKMTVAIPAFLPQHEQEFVEWPHKGSIKRSNLVAQIESLNFKNIQPLVNKPPVWSDKRHAWTLNFHGRVTKASVKNFQLCRPEDFDHVVLQHGRVGQDTFTMDVAWPLSVMQALAVCLSSLHAKLGVE